MAKRKDEEICRECFEVLAKVSLHCSTVEWYEVPKSDEPPDWFLTLDGKRFAVEATTITEVFKWNDSMLGISARYRNLCKSIEKQAQAEGVLKGVYVVRLSPMADYRAIEPKLRDWLLEYIRDTVDQPSAREKVLVEEGPHRVSIQKLHNKRNLIGEVILFGVRCEGEAIQRLSVLLQSTLKQKSKNLRQVTEPVILLLLDRYHYCDEGEWVLSLTRVEERSFFHTICRIAPPDGSSLLFTKETSWPAPLKS
jgi:hypothetical protein